MAFLFTKNSIPLTMKKQQPKTKPIKSKLTIRTSAELKEARCSAYKYLLP